MRNGIGSQERKKHAKSVVGKGVARTLGLRCLVAVMTVSMVLSGDGVAYGVRAFAQTQQSPPIESATADNDELTSAKGLQDADARGGDPASDGAAKPDDALELADVDKPDGTDKPDDVEEPDVAEESESLAAAHSALAGDLFVRLSFARDGEQAAPQAVTVKLQRRTQTWDADAGAWSPLDESAADAGWSDVIDEATGTPVAVHLSAEAISTGVLMSRADDDAANDGAAYTFANRSVQTVTADGAYDARYEYRAVVTNVDGAPEDVIGYNARFASADATTRTQTYVVEAANTSAGDADYTVTVSTEATLRAEEELPLGAEVRVRLVSASVEERRIELALVPGTATGGARTGEHAGAPGSDAG